MRLRVSGFLNTRVIEIVSDTAAVIWLRIAQTGAATAAADQRTLPAGICVSR